MSNAARKILERREIAQVNSLGLAEVVRRLEAFNTLAAAVQTAKRYLQQPAPDVEQAIEALEIAQTTTNKG